MNNYNQYPQTSLIKQIPYFSYEKLSLTNGIDFYAVKADDLKITEVFFILDKGIWDQKHLLVANFVSRLISEGTKRYTAEQINEKIDFWGGQYHKHVNMHSSIFQITVLNKYLEDFIELFHSFFCEPLFDAKEFELYRNIMKNRFLVEKDKVENIAQNKINELLYSSQFVYGQSATENDYDNLNTYWLSEYWQENFKPQNLKIVVTSENPDYVLKIVDNFFGKHKLTKHTQNSTITIPVPSPQTVKIKQKGAKQAAIAMGWRVDNKDQQQLYKLNVLVNYLGGFFGSVLMQNIRQDKGLTYSIRSNMPNYRYATAVVVYSEVNLHNKNIVPQEILSEVSKIQQGQISIENLQRTKNYLQGLLLRNIDGKFKCGKLLSWILSNYRDLDYLEHYNKAIMEIDIDEMKLLAQKYLQLDKSYCVIVG